MYLHRFTAPRRKLLPTLCGLAFAGFGFDAMVRGVTTGDLWLVVTGACCFLLALGSAMLSTKKELGEIRWNDDRLEYSVDDREVIACDWSDISSVRETRSGFSIKCRRRWRGIGLPNFELPKELKQLLSKRAPAKNSNPSTPAAPGTSATEVHPPSETT